MAESVDAFQSIPFEFFKNGWHGYESLSKFCKGTTEGFRYGRIKVYFEKHLYISLSSQSHKIKFLVFPNVINSSFCCKGVTSIKAWKKANTDYKSTS